MPDLKCPGQDKRFWKPTDIFEEPCPNCGTIIEFWKDDIDRYCKKCGTSVRNPKFDPGCAKWCKFAKQCLGINAPVEQYNEKQNKEGGFAMKKVKRKIIKIDEKKCDGCGLCITSCPEQAIQIINGKAQIVKEFYCDGLGACLGACPTGALTVEEREAEVYNEEATIARIKEVAPDMLETHLKHMQEHADQLPEHHSHKMPHGVTGCPSAREMSWQTQKKETKSTEKINSELRQWPIQLHLVSPLAPYFQNADLLIVADCVPFAYANFHQDFLSNNAIVIGCPKLDDIGIYKEKLSQIFSVSGIKSIKILHMEVPCCFGLQKIVNDALVSSGKKIPVKEVVVGIKGDIYPEGA